MKMRYLLVALLALTFGGCDDNTGSLGIDMMRPEDHINGMVENYDVISQSILIDSIYAKTSMAYLGMYTDPQFGGFEADFMTQFTAAPGYELTFPPKNDFPEIGSKEQEISANIYLYYQNFFGDSLNACKLRVYELNKTFEEGNKDNYYTNIDPSDYYDKDAGELATKSYTAIDLSLSQAKRDSIKAGYYPAITIPLPERIAKNILEKYYSNPTDFSTPEKFIEKVFKGIYVQCIDGDGTILYIGAMQLGVNFHFYTKRPSTGKVDSLVTNGGVRFAATKEIIQTNRFQNKGKLQEVIKEENHTYLKTPAGIFTEVTLPISKVINGNDPDKTEEYKNDSINSVSLSFTCYNQENSIFKVPATVLMVRKKDMYSFFENNQVPNNITSYLSAYSSNKYTFSNIANLVTTCINEKKNLKGNKSDADWEKENPDWNKVVLIPVSLTTQDNNSQNIAISNIIKVEHDLQMNSVKLKGGNPIKGGSTTNMKVIYSRFKGLN